MRYQARPWQIFQLMFLLSSCMNINTRTAFEDVENLAKERLGKNIQWNQNSEDDKIAGVAVDKLLSDTLTVDSAVQVALLNNPDIQVVYENLGIAQADLVQAGLLRNPVFDSEIHFVGGGIGTGTNLNIFQDFIDIFQLPLRKKIAASSFESTKLDVASKVLSLVGEVKQAFYSLQGSEELLSLRRHILTGLQASSKIVKRQHDAGNISDLDIATEQQLYAKAKLELAQSEANVALEREKLSYLMGLWGKNINWKIFPRLPELPAEEVEVNGLETLAIENRLDLQSARKVIESVGLSLGIAKAYRLIPELSGGVDLEGEGRSGIIPGPNFQFPLPIFDQGQARVAGAKAVLRQAQKRYLALATKVRSEVRMSRNQMLASKARAQYAKEVLIPVSEQTTLQTQLHYNGMIVGVFQLISAKKEEILAGNTYVEALRDYWLAYSELETAVGGSFSQHNSHHSEKDRSEKDKSEKDSLEEECHG